MGEDYINEEQILVVRTHYNNLRSVARFLPLVMLILTVICTFIGVYMGIALGESTVFNSCYTKGTASTTSSLLINVDMTCHVENMQKGKGIAK